MVGMLALAGQMRQMQRRAPLPVYGPSGTVAKVESLFAIDPELRSLFEAVEPSSGQLFIKGISLRVQAIALEGAEIPRYAYLFFEDSLPGRAPH